MWQEKVGGSWSSWQPLGGTNTSDPAVAGDSQDYLNVFALGTDDKLYTRRQTDNSQSGSWNGWQSLGGTWISDPVAILNPGTDCQEVFLQGDNGDLYVLQQAPTSNPLSNPPSWSNINTVNLGGASWISNPAVGVNANNCLEVFILGFQSLVYTLAQTSPGVWPSNPSWTSIGSVPVLSTMPSTFIRGRSRGRF